MLDVFVPGIMVLIAFGAGMGAGWPIIWELDSGVIERFRVTPASRLALLLALLTAACSATSSALGLKLKQIGSLAAVVTGTQLPLTLLAGILLPLSLGPTWLRVLGHINPMYYAVQAARSLAAGTVASGTVGVGFLVTAGIAGLALWWGTRAYQQAMA